MAAEGKAGGPAQVRQLWLSPDHFDYKEGGDVVVKGREVQEALKASQMAPDRLARAAVRVGIVVEF